MTLGPRAHALPIAPLAAPPRRRLPPELGVLEVTLIGGEAYLRPDWTEIVRAVPSSVRLSLDSAHVWRANRPTGR